MTRPLGLSAILLALAACPSPQPPKPPADPLPTSRYIFIERHTSTVGECVEGACPPGPMIDFPTYAFDRSTGELSGRIDFPVDDALLAVFGDGRSLQGAAGSGVATRLSPVIALPHAQEPWTLTALRGDGTISLRRGDLTLNLSPGQIWTETRHEERRGDDYLATITITERIENFGAHAKAKISPR